ncbi:hypothetical protein FH972_024020 [Carpinus fangiana]|uniref:SWI-SNF chromatin-remodeling complex protein n=1 Tax=Carpinus fangiana TaxID=176857 RepID=A0A5N6KXB6_9ROSI|nr:hypothetical protein FH972_024020 [Carpinus fangiana]
MAGRAPPPNFKTDVHRNVTKKWAGARNVAYDGDDWGGYDEYGDYSEEPLPPVPPSAVPTTSNKPTGLRQRGQASTPNAEPSRNFTAPPSTQQPPQSPQQPLHKAGSFDYGDDRRDFSAGHPSNVQHPVDSRPYSRGQQSATSSQGQHSLQSAGSPPPSAHTQALHPSQLSQDPGHDFYQRRDFSPSAVPQPLSQRSPPSTATSDRASGHTFPPRKSSLGQNERPDMATVMMSAPDAAPPQSADEAPRPLFVRPADIYKRMEAERERERQSMDSASRPSGASIDQSRSVNPQPHSVQGAPRMSVTGPVEMDAGPVLTSGNLGGVRSGYGMDGLPIREEPTKTTPVVDAPLLPKLDRFSGFGSDMWGSSGFSEPSELSSTAEDPNDRSEVSAVSDAALKEQPSMGFRSAVERAFDAEGASTLSPVAQSGGGSQRSNQGSDFSRTDSTAGISPIVSRAPSGAAPAMRTHDRDVRHEASPAIAEEPTSATSDDPRRTSGTTVRDPTAAHSRNISAESGSSYRRNMEIPSPDNSPARHPAIAINQPLQPPAEGELAVTTPVSPKLASGGSAAAPSSRNPSPSKGRVANLTNKYDTDSRRNSGSSIASWASSKRSASPVKDAAGNGVSSYTTSDALAVKQDPSRPHLPGEWVSYATTATNESGASLAETKTIRGEPSSQSETNRPGSETVPDFSPSASKSSTTQAAESGTGPMAALASAGAAIAASLTQVASGSGATGERDFASGGSADVSSEVSKDRLVPGEVSSFHPTGASLGAGEAASSASSFAPTPSPMMSPMRPTPPPKDTPLTETINRVSGYFPAPPAPLKGRETAAPPTLRTDKDSLAPADVKDSADRLESERLNEEIERSLTPGNASTAAGLNSSQLVPPSPNSPNMALRESSLFPHEYDSYWNGSEFDQSSQPSRGVSAAGLGAANVAADRPPGRQLSDTPSATNSPRPGMLANRFSWEADEEPSVTAEKVEASKPSQEVFQESKALDEANKRQFGSSDLPSPAVAPAALPNIQTSFENERKASINEAAGSATLSAALADDSSMMTSQSADRKNSPSAYSSAPATGRTPATPAADHRPAYVHPAPLKELMASIKTPKDRIERYDQIRTQFGSMSTGLDDWLAHMVSSHPEHHRAAISAPHLTADATTTGLAGSVRNKISPAMSKFTNKSSSGTGSTPYYQQYLASASTLNAQSASSQQSTASSGPMQDPNFKGRSPSQTKGKDLFGSIGGKASHSAKGLFAKGKSKLRAASTEKAQAPPPRPPSSVPSSFVSPSDNPNRMSRFFRRSSSQGNVLATLPEAETSNTRKVSHDSKLQGASDHSKQELPSVADQDVATTLGADKFVDTTVQTSTRDDVQLPTVPYQRNNVTQGVDTAANLPLASYQVRKKDDETEDDGSGRDSFHSARDNPSRAASSIDVNLLPISKENPISPIAENPPETSWPTVGAADAGLQDASSDHSLNTGREIASPTATAASVTAIPAVTAISPATALGSNVPAEAVSSLPAADSAQDLPAHSIVQETVQQPLYHNQHATEDIRNYDEHHGTLPTQTTNVLPSQHDTPLTPNDQPIEFDNPRPGAVVPENFPQAQSYQPSQSNQPSQSSKEPEPNRLEHEPSVISQREGPSDQPRSRPFANARDDAEYERPRSSHSRHRSRSRSGSASAPRVVSSQGADAQPPLPQSPSSRPLSVSSPMADTAIPSALRVVSLPISRPVPVSSPSADMAFAAATTNRRPHSGDQHYASNLRRSTQRIQEPVLRDQWYTPSDPASQRYVDARTYDTEYSIPGLGPDPTLPAPEKVRSTVPSGEVASAKEKKESKVRSIYGRLRSRSRSRSRSGIEDPPPATVTEEPLPTALDAPRSRPSFLPHRARAASGPTVTTTTTTTTSRTGAKTSVSTTTTAPWTRIDPRLPSQTFAASPEVDDLEDGRRPSIMHDPDPLPTRTLPKMSKKDDVEQRRMLRRHQNTDDGVTNDEKARNRKSWFGGMFSSSRSASSTRKEFYSEPSMIKQQPSSIPPQIPQLSTANSGNNSATIAAAAALASQPSQRTANKLTKAPSKSQRDRDEQKQRQRIRPTSITLQLARQHLGLPPEIQPSQTYLH